MQGAVFTVPSSVIQNIARAKAFLHRGEPIKAVEAVMAALNIFEPKKIVGKAKYEAEILLMEAVDDLSHNPQIAAFLKDLTHAKEPRIAYVPGEEEKLASVLPLILKVLKEDAEQAEQNVEGNREDRRSTLWLKGAALLQSPDSAPRGKAMLRRLLEEFNAEPGIFSLVGEAFCQANLGTEATDILEEAIRRDPEDSKSYGYLANIYTEMQEFPKAELIYKKVLKRFGKHPKTLINFASMYKKWNKRDNCYEIAGMAVKEAPDSAEARDLLKWADR